MSKWLNSYDYKDDNELVVTITLAEYRELLSFWFKSGREMDGVIEELKEERDYVDALKLELKRNGITVPMRDSAGDAEVE